MTIPNDVTVYCDANFLVAYGAKQTKQPERQKRAQILFAELLRKNCKIAASPLSFDEAWNGVRRETGPKIVKNTPLFNFCAMPTLNWIGKEKIVNHDKDVPFRLMRKNKKYSLGQSEILILEGDNLDVELMPVGGLVLFYASKN